MVNGTRQGGLVGLHSRQAGWVQNYRAKLLAEGRPQSQIDRMAQQYSNKLLRQRGETIARTETMKALSAGRHEAVAQLIENPNNDVQAQDIKVKWDSAGDGKVRPTHAAANGQTVQYGDPFIVGGFSMLHPLDSSLGAPAEEVINCRCYEDVIIDFFARLE